ncbi:MAG: hypothetical protein KKC01_11755 [Gammaproteobacteria bacterium]|nr:hypothetical protein [Gammaproteobacteria bacterium]
MINNVGSILKISIYMLIYSYMQSAAPCDYSIPWIGEDLAMRIMSDKTIKIESLNDGNNLSIAVQSYLWKQINTFSKDVEFKNINEVVNNIDNDQDEIIFLVQILYRMYGDKIISGTKFDKKYFDDWNNNYLINNQNKLALYHLVLGNKNNNEYISDEEIKHLKTDTFDLDILRNLAIKYENQGELDKAHGYYLLAVESGSYSALYGLSSIEHKIDECTSRGKDLMLFLIK